MTPAINESTITVNGQDYVCRLDFDFIYRVESTLKKSLTRILLDAGDSNLPVSEAAQIIALALAKSPGAPRLTNSQVFEALYDEGPGPLLNIAVGICLNALTRTAKPGGKAEERPLSTSPPTLQ